MVGVAGVGIKDIFQYGKENLHEGVELRDMRHRPEAIRSSSARADAHTLSSKGEHAAVIYATAIRTET